MTPTMTAPPKNKIRIKQITINQVEGPQESCIKTTHETWASAEERVQSICRTAPRDGSYFKCDFVIIYTCGEVYTGRLDCAHPSSKSYEGTLADHVRAHLTFCAGLRRPDHIPEARYEALLAEYEKDSPGFKDRALAMLKNYALEDLMDTTPTILAPPQKDARQAREENIAFAKANNLAMVPIIGNTYPVKGLLYVMGGRWDDKSKTWSVPSHKAAEAQAATDTFAKPTKSQPTPVPTMSPTGRTDANRPVLQQLPRVATPQNLAVANLNAMTPRPAPVTAPKPAKAKAKGAPMLPLQKRLNALLTGAKTIHDSVPPGDLIRPQLAFAINHIQEALDRLG